ncbi:hypothetical protein [Roseitalea porphyridii]|uniref:Uncharacterized protein n=1 Tax=Roseitalea porphyridii TaxID=1852022 RepID=A0A4P6V1L9_9HYPH|nr:hypothetical protein [Roseitalea porphyridii]QBK30549.1 hypothetical protein E0E05_08025 [Roseitalea porphyridii]
MGGGPKYTGEQGSIPQPILGGQSLLRGMPIHDWQSELQHCQDSIDATSAKIFENARNYYTLLTSVGYAGFFAVWAFSRSYLPENAQIATGLLIAISILTFITYEIFQIVYLQYAAAQHVKKLANRDIPTDFSRIHEYIDQTKMMTLAYQRNVRTASIGLISVWLIFFPVSLLSGFSAGIILIYNFSAHLLGWSYFPS